MFEWNPTVYMAAVWLPLLYGSETWAPVAKQLKRLQSFVMHCLQVILRVAVREKQLNTYLRGRANIETVETMVRKRRMRWLGHVARTNEGIKKLLVCRLEAGKQAVVGQKIRWSDVVTKDLKRCKIGKDWREIAQDHDEWKPLLRQK